MNRINIAARMACLAHASIDQRRKGGEQYLVHPARVAGIIEEYLGEDAEAAICASWLHDVVEDVPEHTSLDDIGRALGAGVAQLVFEMTHVTVTEDGTRAVRKAVDRMHYAAASPTGQSIKVADILDNIVGIDEAEPKFAPTFLAECQMLVDVLVLADPQLRDECQRMLTIMHTKVGPQQIAELITSYERKEETNKEAVEALAARKLAIA